MNFQLPYDVCVHETHQVRVSFDDSTGASFEILINHQVITRTSIQFCQILIECVYLAVKCR